MENRIPGPGIFSFIKNVRANPVIYYYQIMKQYGDVVRFRSLQDIYLINNPVPAKDVFLNSHKSFDKNNFINNRLKDVIGDVVVLSTRERWKSIAYSGKSFNVNQAMLIPFGMGPRKCQGMGLAKMIINVVLSELVSHFKLTIDMKITPAIQSRITLGSNTDLEIFLHPR